MRSFNGGHGGYVGIDASDCAAAMYQERDNFRGYFNDVHIFDAIGGLINVEEL